MSWRLHFLPDPTELREHYPNAHEHRADLIVHLVGLVAAAIGGGILFMISLARGLPLATGIALYALSLMLMLTASALYNLTRPSKARRVLRRLDEGAIFLLIAGSYTPFTLHLLDPTVGLWATIAVWVAALAGAAGKMFLPNLGDRFWCCVYVGFGWVSLFLLGPMTEKLPLWTVLALAAGGVVYTSGVFIYLNPKVAFRRAIWHGFVVVGAGLQFAAVAAAVTTPL